MKKDLETKKYNLELTEAEIKSIGTGRWVHPNRWKILATFTVIAVFAIILLVLAGDTHSWSWGRALAILGYIPLFVFLAIFLKKMSKAGDRFLESVSRGE